MKCCYSLILVTWSYHLSCIWQQGRRHGFKSEGGGTCPAQSGRKRYFVAVPFHFFGSKSTISRFGERFRDGQYSLVSFLFAVLLLTVPPPCHMESAPLSDSRICCVSWDMACWLLHRLLFYDSSSPCYTCRVTRQYVAEVLFQSFNACARLAIFRPAL